MKLKTILLATAIFYIVPSFLTWDFIFMAHLGEWHWLARWLVLIWAMTYIALIVGLTKEKKKIKPSEVLDKELFMQQMPNTGEPSVKGCEPVSKFEQRLQEMKDKRENAQNN